MHLLAHETDFTDVPHGGALDRAALAELYAHPLPVGAAAWVRANFIAALDGAIAVEGRSGGLGSPDDKTVFHLLRAMCDVVLVGAGTVRAEGYGGAVISTADRAARSARGQSEVPPIAVVSGSANLDTTGPLFTRSAVPPIVLTTAAAPAERTRALADAGAEVVVAGTDHVSAPAAVAELSSRGLGRILCEGGPYLFGALVAADLVDELCVTTSPHLVAGADGRMATSPVGALHRMRRELLLGADDDYLYARWVRDRTGR